MPKVNIKGTVNLNKKVKIRTQISKYFSNISALKSERAY
jgi:hypothetical protein